MKVLFLVNIPSPYRVDFFNELGKHCDLTVLYERKQSAERNNNWSSKSNGNYTEILLKGFKTGVNHALSLEIFKHIKKFKNDIIVIGGYSTPTAMLAIAYMKLFKIKYFLNADGGMIGHDNFLNYAVKKFFISGACGYLSTGKQTDDYFCHYGAKRENIKHYPFTSILNRDIAECPLSNEEKLKLRKELNLPLDKKIAIAVGQFIPRKGFEALLEVWKDLNKEYVLLLVGEGPLKEQYLNFKLENLIIVNFQKKESLFNYYKASDIFILPTNEDIWGLVINEAMANGLPVISTDKCVAAVELVEENKNGYVVPVNNLKSIAPIVKELFTDQEKARIIGQNNIEKMKNGYSIEQMAIVTEQIFKEEAVK